MKKTKAIFKEERCDRSPFCPVARICPTGAVKLVREGFLKRRISYQASECIGCGKCVKACPHAAFVMK